MKTYKLQKTMFGRKLERIAVQTAQDFEPINIKIKAQDIYKDKEKITVISSNRKGYRILDTPEDYLFTNLHFSWFTMPLFQMPEIAREDRIKQFQIERGMAPQILVRNYLTKFYENISKSLSPTKT